ncbi:MAG: CinA family nicotinamide mononucleotide deamidase-related protein [Myxococcales bacterium]|nr:CinA family nicotinamide mononucleotide deamidase-related protein [Myxococcales bacterium]
MIEMICIGDELLDGRVQDGHTAWFASQLFARGRSLSRSTLIGDQQQVIVEALRRACERSTYVLVTGGLGPTEDDRTRQAAADWLGAELVEDPEAAARMAARFARFKREPAATNQVQTLFPRGAEVLQTDVGTAAGFRCSVGDCVVDFVPGVRSEMHWFAQTYSLPFLLGNEPVGGRRKWVLFGLGESDVAQRLGVIERPGIASFHYNAHFPEIHLLARAEPGRDRELEALNSYIEERVGDHFIYTEGSSLVDEVKTELDSRHWTLATAESCTGGMISKMLTDVAGSSTFFNEGAVTYSNAAKVRQLGVLEETLAANGAVSAEVAREMAAGVRERSGSNLGLSVTGIAGPGGGSDYKPVGTVFIGCSTEAGTFVDRLDLGERSRDAIRTLTAWAVLSKLLWFLRGRDPKQLWPL